MNKPCSVFPFTYKLEVPPPEVKVIHKHGKQESGFFNKRRKFKSK